MYTMPNDEKANTLSLVCTHKHHKHKFNLALLFGGKFLYPSHFSSAPNRSETTFSSALKAPTRLIDHCNFRRERDAAMQALCLYLFAWIAAWRAPRWLHWRRSHVVSCCVVKIYCCRVCMCVIWACLLAWKMCSAHVLRNAFRIYCSSLCTWIFPINPMHLKLRSWSKSHMNIAMPMQHVCQRPSIYLGCPHFPCTCIDLCIFICMVKQGNHQHWLPCFQKHRKNFIRINDCQKVQRYTRNKWYESINMGKRFIHLCVYLYVHLVPKPAMLLQTHAKVVYVWTRVPIYV